MDPGDAITHVFTPNSGSTLDEDGKVLPEVLDAQRRGVLIDTANDGNNFGSVDQETPRVVSTKSWMWVLRETESPDWPLLSRRLRQPALLTFLGN